jgi:excisionase family DNA binding protein
MTRLLLTVPEAAEVLAISRSKLYELLASGAIASIRIDGSRRIPLTARACIRLYVTPRIGHLPIQAVRPSTITKLYRDLLTSGGRDG